MTLKTASVIGGFPARRRRAHRLPRAIHLSQATPRPSILQQPRGALENSGACHLRNLEPVVFDEGFILLPRPVPPPPCQASAVCLWTELEPRIG